jgi:hypothetical protein
MDAGIGESPKILTCGQGTGIGVASDNFGPWALITLVSLDARALMLRKVEPRASPARSGPEVAEVSPIYLGGQDNFSPARIAQKFPVPPRPASPFARTGAAVTRYSRARLEQASTIAWRLVLGRWRVIRDLRGWPRRVRVDIDDARCALVQMPITPTQRARKVPSSQWLPPFRRSHKGVPFSPNFR